MKTCRCLGTECKGVHEAEFDLEYTQHMGDKKYPGHDINGYYDAWIVRYHGMFAGTVWYDGKDRIWKYKVMDRQSIVGKSREMCYSMAKVLVTECLTRLPDYFKHHAVDSPVKPAVIATSAPVQEVLSVEKVVVSQAPALHPSDFNEAKARHIFPGVLYIPKWLNIAQQIDILNELRPDMKHMHTPTMPDGTPMSVSLFCYGLNWSLSGYSDETLHMRNWLHTIWHRALNEAGISLVYSDLLSAQTAIVNMYREGAKLGMHVDKQESQALRDAGRPIVTVSVGDDATFRIGGFERDHHHKDITVKSGDLIVMYGDSRNRYHGIMKVATGTAPKELNLKRSVRMSITMREVRA